MVALLVLFTIVGCLVADSIVMSVRERRVVAVSGRKLTGAESLVFAQDGGKPIKKETETETETVEKDS